MTDVDTDGQSLLRSYKLSKIIFFVFFEDSAASHSSDAFIKKVKCIPQKGDWQGGDEVLIIMPYPIKQRGIFNSLFLNHK
jgi:hypothetical protein